MTATAQLDWTAECRAGRADAKTMLQAARETDSPIRLVQALSDLSGGGMPRGWVTGFAHAIAEAAMH